MWECVTYVCKTVSYEHEWIAYVCECVAYVFKPITYVCYHVTYLYHLCTLVRCISITQGPFTSYINTKKYFLDLKTVFYNDIAKDWMSEKYKFFIVLRYFYIGLDIAMPIYLTHYFGQMIENTICLFFYLYFYLCVGGICKIVHLNYWIIKYYFQICKFCF